jgi:predicted component of type VI protein secretion system
MGAAMPAQLVALTEGSRILVDKPILLLGRDSECDIQFESRKISRRHCCIAQVGDQLVVRDLGSTNGIRINGVRVVEGYLKAGDELAIGNHRYQVRWDTLPADAGRPRVKAPPEQRAAASPAGRAVEEDDEVLESCDDPVPLGDPDEVAREAIPAKEKKDAGSDPIIPVIPLAQEPPPASPPAPPPEQAADGIPDVLKLAPASDPDFPGARGRKPPEPWHPGASKG